MEQKSVYRVADSNGFWAIICWTFARLHSGLYLYTPIQYGFVGSVLSYELWQWLM